jgi:NAD+ synthase
VKFDPEKFTDQAVKFLQDYLKQSRREKVVIGLSGGLDSAVVYCLAVEALGVDNVITVAMPNGEQGEGAYIDACSVANSKNGFVRQVVDISPMVKSAVKVLDGVGQRYGDTRLRLGNIAARERMVVLYDIAATEDALVLGTENKTEHYLGYFTRWGDQASDVELIRDLYKTEVRELAHYLGVPQKIIEKPPSADLWEGQTDEDELGVSYDDADKVIEGLLSGNYPTELISKGLKGVAVVEKRMRETEFKRQEVPYPRI